MQCNECGGPLVSVLERSRKVCASCYLRHRFRAEQRPTNEQPDGVLHRRDESDDEDAWRKTRGQVARPRPRSD